MSSIMSSPGGGVDLIPQKASQACAACRKQKRRCDKAIPSCTLCTRMGRVCDYSDASPTPSSDDFVMLRQKVQDLEQKLLLSSQGSNGSNGSPSTNGSGISSTIGMTGMNGLSSMQPRPNIPFPAMFFLDSDAFEDQSRTVARPTVSIPGDVLATLGSNADVQHIVGTFFMTIHTWLPIVSKKRLYALLSNSNAEPGADHALLFLCMKLIIEIPQEGIHPSESPTYRMAKNFFTTVETTALLTVQLVQASVLISAYEVGHGIYPAAYLSTGHSARLAYAMGLHSRKDAPQMLKRFPTWGEQEEVRRVWWAVLILDRYVNLGSRGHPLATDDPQQNGVLPCDDNLWDLGEMTTSEPIFVSSPTNIQAGAFARTCQAAHLAGRVVRHKNDRSLDSPFRFSEAAQIHHTVSALATLLQNEFEATPENISTAIAVCYSTLLNLYESYCCTETNSGQHTVEETEMQTIAIAGLKGIAEEVLRLSQHLKRAMTYDIAAISPLIADSLYYAAANFGWLVREKGTPDMVESYNGVVETLKLLDMRWKVAGEYIKILDATEVHADNNGQNVTQPYPY